MSKEKNKRRGIYGLREFTIYLGMIKRCYNEKCSTYQYYGGKGIKVCDRWIGVGGYRRFLEDMGQSPSKDYTLDRYPNNNGDYEPSNCRWATRIEQGRNKSNNRFITYDKDTMTLSDWARRLDTTPMRIASLIKSNKRLSEEDILRRLVQEKSTSIISTQA